MALRGRARIKAKNDATAVELASSLDAVKITDPHTESTATDEVTTVHFPMTSFLRSRQTENNSNSSFPPDRVEFRRGCADSG